MQLQWSRPAASAGILTASWRTKTDDTVPGTISETFFRPDELARERLTIPAPLYNGCRLAFRRSDNGHAFVPVRSMQIQAVVGPDEVIFVDSQSYAVQEGMGGKLICLAWAFRHETGRENLTEPAPIELIYYREDSRPLHSRLVGEFAQALELCVQRWHKTGCETRAATVLTFGRRNVGSE